MAQYLSDFFAHYALAALLCCVVAFLFGGVNFAIIVSTVARRKDIRTCGSGNPGATNMMRSFGPVAGLLTFAGDVLKGVAAVLLAGLLVRALTPEGTQRIAVDYLAGLFCVLGHVFPLFFQFRGGKGVSASLGVLLALDYRVALICFAAFLIVTAVTRYVSMGSVTAAVFVPITAFLLHLNAYDTGTLVLSTVICVLLSVTVVLRHRANIARLRKGSENKLSLKYKSKA